MINISPKFFTLDWLEVFCIEPVAMDADFFKKDGWQVDKRAYGTPVYREMFTLFGNDGKPLLEIRRNPMSLKKNGGIFDVGACHIRLSNRTCYLEHTVEILQKFLVKYKYQFRGISRIDLACDSLVFDNGMDGGQLISSYMRGHILKNRNSRVCAHGRETANSRAWNSIKWGSPNSPVSTKIYNKTQELKEQSNKRYIKECWVNADMVEYQQVFYDVKDKKTGQTQTKTDVVVVEKGKAKPYAVKKDDVQEANVWRVEFSIKSEARQWIEIEKGKSLTISLLKFINRHRIKYMFLLLSKWCCNFVKAETNKEGSYKRKDRCEEIQLFSEKNLELTYKPQRITLHEDPTRTDRILMHRLFKLSEAQESRLSLEAKEMCLKLGNEMAKMHGQIWVNQAEWNKMLELDKKIKQEEAQEKKEFQLEADYVQSEDWITRWEQGNLSKWEKSVLKRFHADTCAKLAIKASRKVDSYLTCANIALKDYEFWSGKDMQPITRQALHAMPF